MRFTFLKNKFLGQGLDIIVNGEITLETEEGKLKLSGWEEVRELMYKMEEVNKEAALTKRTQHYGKCLALYLEEGQWILWWKKNELPLTNTLLRELPIILRYFLKRYHKIMMDYHSMLLKEGFELDTNNNSYKEMMDYRGL